MFNVIRISKKNANKMNIFRTQSFFGSKIEIILFVTEAPKYAEPAELQKVTSREVLALSNCNLFLHNM